MDGYNLTGTFRRGGLLSQQHIESLNQVREKLKMKSVHIHLRFNTFVTAGIAVSVLFVSTVLLAANSVSYSSYSSPVYGSLGNNSSSVSPRGVTP
jgi:hypothetical protein